MAGRYCCSLSSKALLESSSKLTKFEPGSSKGYIYKNMKEKQAGGMRFIPHLSSWLRADEKDPKFSVFNGAEQMGNKYYFNILLRVSKCLSVDLDDFSRVFR